MAVGLSERILERIDQATPPALDARLDRLQKATNEYGFDELGFSRDWFRRVVTLSGWLYKHYFRMTTTGLDELPAGPVILAGNHSSQMAYDALLIITALLLEAEPPRHAVAMAGHFFFGNPLYSQLLPRIGQVNGTPANCRKLLARGELILVFPEGEKGGGKTLFNRYELMPFRHGFMRLAMETDTPVVPFGFVGGEEMVPSLSRMEPLAARLGLPYLNLSPLGPLPLPVRCSLHLGPPRRFGGDPADSREVRRNVERVSEDVRELLDRGLRQRRSVF